MGVFGKAISRLGRLNKATAEGKYPTAQGDKKLTTSRRSTMATKAAAGAADTARMRERMSVERMPEVDLQRGTFRKAKPAKRR